MVLMLVGTVLGAIFSFLLIVWVESERRPKVVMGIAPPVDRQYTGLPANDARFLEITVQNLALPRWLGWLLRQAAGNCRATIALFQLDGEPVFKREIPARWSASPEPVATIEGYIESPRQRLVLIDRARISFTSQVDIPPGESERLGIAGRFDGDSDCYLWSNESYFSNPAWRNPDLRLPQGRYLLRVVVRSSGQKHVALFRINNQGPKKQFRLDPAMPEDHKKDDDGCLSV
jgi:hypothetical protein